MKYCRECGERKPLDEFHNDKSRPDGKTVRCKECNRARSRANGVRRRAEDKEALNAYHKTWMHAHPGRKAQYDGPRLKRLRENEPERLREYGNQWRASHAASVSAYGMVRRARKSGNTVDIVVNRFVVAERDGWICQICLEPIDPNSKHKLDDGSYNPWHLHIDHIMAILDGGEHSYANVRATHARCNLSRPKGRRLNV